MRFCCILTDHPDSSERDAFFPKSLAKNKTFLAQILSIFIGRGVFSRFDIYLGNQVAKLLSERLAQLLDKHSGLIGRIPAS